MQKTCGNDIDFILVFGSVSRGEFIAGISDIDMIIQTKTKAAKGQVSKIAEKIFWETNSACQTRFDEVCSISKTRRDLEDLEKAVKLYKPFEVIGPNDVDWKNGAIISKELALWSWLVPKQLFAKKIKIEGRVLFGRNVLDEISPRDFISDKIKALFLPQALSFGAMLISPFLPDRALRYATKAIFYTLENELYLIGLPLGRGAKYNISNLRSMLGDFYASRLVDEARLVKGSFERVSKKWTRLDKVGYGVSAFFFVMYLNWAVFLRRFIFGPQNIVR